MREGIHAFVIGPFGGMASLTAEVSWTPNIQYKERAAVAQYQRISDGESAIGGKNQNEQSSCFHVLV